MPENHHHHPAPSGGHKRHQGHPSHHAHANHSRHGHHSVSSAPPSHQQARGGPKKTVPSSGGTVILRGPPEHSSLGADPLKRPPTAPAGVVVNNRGRRASGQQHQSHPHQHQEGSGGGVGGGEYLEGTGTPTPSEKVSRWHRDIYMMSPNGTVTTNHSAIAALAAATHGAIRAGGGGVGVGHQVLHPRQCLCEQCMAEFGTYKLYNQMLRSESQQQLSAAAPSSSTRAKHSSGQGQGGGSGVASDRNVPERKGEANERPPLTMSPVKEQSVDDNSSKDHVSFSTIKPKLLKSMECGDVTRCDTVSVQKAKLQQSR